MSETDFNSMLIDVAKNLAVKDLNIMKFMCKDIIKKRDMEKVKEVLDLFTELQTREKITNGNLSFLKQLLERCEKPSAIRVVEQYETGVRNGEVPMDTGLQHQPQAQALQQAQPVPHQVFPHPFSTSPSRSEDPVVQLKLNGLRNEFNYLTKNLGREWRFFVRALDMQDVDVDSVEADYPRSLKDQIYQCLVVWVRQNSAKATKEELIKALRDGTVERYDLASKMEKGSY